MEGYSPLKAHAFFESITWENLHHQTPPKLTAYLPAMSEDDEDCYGNVRWLVCIRNNLGRDGFCLSYFMKMVPLCLGSLCPSITELFDSWDEGLNGEASIDLDTAVQVWVSEAEVAFVHESALSAGHQALGWWSPFFSFFLDNFYS